MDYALLPVTVMTKQLSILKLNLERNVESAVKKGEEIGFSVQQVTLG